MKKIFTYSFIAALFSLGAPAFADETETSPMFTMTFDREAVETTFAFSVSLTDGGSVQVDWGDGELKSYDVNDYDVLGPTGWVFTEITGEIAGTSVKVYGEDATKVNYLDISWTLESSPEARVKAVNLANLSGVKEFGANKNSLTRLDCSAMVSTIRIEAIDNQLEELILPESENLTTVNVSNNFNVTTGEMNADAGNNQVLATDWSVAPKLSTLKVNGNSYNELGWFDDFDISSNTELSALYANGCDLPELDLYGMSALKTFNAQWNNFKTIDLSSLPAKGAAVMLNHNYLTSIKLPDTTTDKMTRLNVSYNALTFETLPFPNITASAANYVYTNQENIVNPLSGKNVVDLSSQAVVGETESTFKWEAILGEATEPTELSSEGDAADFTVTEPGVFQFNVPVKALTGKIKNEQFPNLELATTAATSVSIMPLLFSMEVNYEEDADDITIGLIDSEGQNVYIDWGDGEFDGPYTIAKDDYDYSPTKPGVIEDWWDEIAPKVKGSKIQVKGEPSTIVTLTVDGSYDWGTGAPTSSRVKSIDLSNLANLKKLSLNNNNLEAVDLSNNPDLIKLSLTSNKLTSLDGEFSKVTSLDISNAISSGKKVYGENEFDSFDFTKFPALTSFTSNANGLKPDFTNAVALTTAYLQANEYTDYAPVSSKITYLSLNYNNLESLDATGLSSTGNINIFLTYNKLGKDADCLKLPASANNVNVANNCFTFASLPAVDSVKGTLTYSPQADMEVEVENGSIDLSEQAKVGETATVFAWADGEGNAIAEEDFTAENGVFKFNKDFKGVVCTMKNEVYPNLTLKTVATDVKAVSAVKEIESVDNAEVEYFNLQGVKVSGAEPGLYIRRQGEKATKVIVR